MKWENLSDVDKDRLAALYATGKLDKDSNPTDIPLKKLEREIKSWRELTDIFTVVQAQEVSDKIPSSSTRRYDDFETVKWDDVIVVSDIEIPDHSPAYILAALYTGIAYKIKKLVINGDLIATDQDGINSWVSTLAEDNEASYETAINTVRKIIEELSSQFDEIVILEGNHDDRVARATKGQVHFGMFLNGTKAVYSRYPYMWVETSRGPVKIVHPQNFSANPITLGQQMYNVEPRKGHLVMGHCHRRQDGWSGDGAFEIHALGCGRDPVRTKYKQRGANKHNQWDRSFLMIKQGWHFPIDLKATNIEAVLGPAMFHSYQRRLAQEGN